MTGSSCSDGLLSRRIPRAFRVARTAVLEDPLENHIFRILYEIVCFVFAIQFAYPFACISFPTQILSEPFFLCSKLSLSQLQRVLGPHSSSTDHFDVLHVLLWSAKLIELSYFKQYWIQILDFSSWAMVPQFCINNFFLGPGFSLW